MELPEDNHFVRTEYLWGRRKSAIVSCMIKMWSNHVRLSVITITGPYSNKNTNVKIRIKIRDTSWIRRSQILPVGYALLSHLKVSDIKRSIIIKFPEHIRRDPFDTENITDWVTELSKLPLVSLKINGTI